MQLNAAKILCIQDFVRFGLGLQASRLCLCVVQIDGFGVRYQQFFLGLGKGSWRGSGEIVPWRAERCIEQLLPNVMQYRSDSEQTASPGCQLGLLSQLR